MSRYIDADDVANAIYHHFPSIRTMADARGIIEEAPSIDIVRCKECRWASPNGKYGCMLKPFSKNDWQYHHLFSDDFCSYGEKKGADDERSNNESAVIFR